jgi:hypothetical protein
MISPQLVSWLMVPEREEVVRAPDLFFLTGP